MQTRCETRDAKQSMPKKDAKQQIPNKLSERCMADEHFKLNDRHTGLCKIIAHNKHFEIVTT